MLKEKTQQNSLAVYFREFTDMPVITYPSSYSPSVNHHSISSAGHTLPKYSSATSSSLNNSYSKYHSSSYNVNSSSPKTYTSNFSRQLNNFKDYKTPISSSSLNYLPNKTNSLHISPNKYNGTSGSLSSTPRSSISNGSPSSSSSSSNGSISSYNNGIASGITLTHYQRRKNSVSDDFISTATNSLKPSTNNFPKIPSPKWKRKSDYQVDWQSIIPKELSGLTNLGNTCYMNSVLQAMYCTDVFRKFVLTNSNKSPLLNSLNKLFDEMQDDKNHVYPGMFRNQFIKQQPKFRGYAQQDAQEFLRYLINGVHDEVNQARSSLRPKNLKSPTSSAEAWQQYKYIDDSPLIDMVAGQLSSTITCTICQYSSTCYDPFLDLSLSLPNGRSECNVQKCLQDFTAVELLAPDELIKCERCNKQTRCTKKLSIVKLPTILILHLKRFSNEGYKLTNPRVKPEETLIINNKPFSLYSIVCHHGYSSRSGHYTAYCHYKDRWYNFNDDKITESTRFETENCGDAYILFYVDKEKDKNYASNYISRL